jgi:hypothetical protein
MHLNHHHHHHHPIPHSHHHHHHHHNHKRRLQYNYNTDDHCRVCCDNCNEYRISSPTPCGGYQMQTINPVKGYTLYQTQCVCNPSLGASNEMFYMKFFTPYNLSNKECPCQCHQSIPRKRGWIGNIYHKNKTLFGIY